MPIIVAKGQPIKAEDIQKLFQQVEKLKSIRVGPGLTLRNLPSGLYLTLASQSSSVASLPTPEFTGQILTGLDNVPVWLLDVYVPALPG